MNIDIYKLMSHDKVETIRTTGLNKLAAALETTTTGRDMPENELFLHSAIQILGEKIYEKRAAFRQISKGIAAYRELRGEKVAGQASEIAGSVLWAPVPSAVGFGVGTGKGKRSKKEQKEADEDGASNIFIPGYGAHNLARRHK